MEKEKPYPAGHNWEGLTPSQVNQGYEEKPLSEKIEDLILLLGMGEVNTIAFLERLKKLLKEALEELKGEFLILFKSNMKDIEQTFIYSRKKVNFLDDFRERNGLFDKRIGKIMGKFK